MWGNGFGFEDDNGVDKVAYRRYILFQVYPDTEEKLDYLHSIYNGSHDFEVWNHDQPTKEAQGASFAGGLLAATSNSNRADRSLGPAAGQRSLHGSARGEGDLLQPERPQSASVGFFAWPHKAEGVLKAVSYRAMEEERRPAPGGRKRTFKDDTTFVLSQYNSWNDVSFAVPRGPS